MKVTIQRFDPTVDPAPYLKDYEVPYEPPMTALKALVYIHENCEPIAFDYSCRARVCGRCAMLVNGKPGTACTIALDDADVLIQPLPGFPVVHDLVVDKTTFYDRISNFERRIRFTPITSDDVKAPMDYENMFLPSKDLEWCCRCGSCMASCPVYNDPKNAGLYCGPANMIAIATRYFDPNDEGDRIGQAVQEGLWNCIMCGMCDEVCPAGDIDHMRVYQILRDEAEARGLTAQKEPIFPYAYPEG